MAVKIKDKKLYYVGGVVRDEIIGVQSFDTDYCYEGNAIEFAKEKGLNIIKENPDFGTVRVVVDGKEIDIASTREETYPKAGHLPAVKNIGCPLHDDLKRRDFTINAMAKNTVTGEIIDYFGGMKDIRNKKLKILHQNSFIDDPTRIIRGLKFSVRFGFELEENTKALQQEYLQNINYDMSYHRLKKELKETFNQNKQISLTKFIEDNIYKLLDNTSAVPHAIPNIEKELANRSFENIWLFYLCKFNLDKLELTKKEKTILRWFNELSYKKVTNNTPKESILMYELWNKVC